MLAGLGSIGLMARRKKAENRGEIANPAEGLGL
ncbi:hypothetical protein [Nitrosospira sp. Is2]